LLDPLETWLPFIPEKNQPTFALFERSAHTPQLEEAARFDEILTNFLA